MKTIKKYKNTLYAAVAIVALAFLYNLLFSASTDTLLELTESPTDVIGREVVQLSDVLNGVTLDDAIFSSPSYLFLTDFSVTVEPQPTGRPNPFNIIGRD